MKKEDQNKGLDMKNLTELKPTTLNLPKAPPVELDRKRKKEQEDRKNLVEYSMRPEFNTETYWGRFQAMFTTINPKYIRVYSSL